LTKLKTAAAVAAVGLLLVAGGLDGTRYALGDKPGEAKKEDNKGGAPPAGKAADARADRDQLQGYWDAGSVTEDGKEFGAAEREAVHVHFKGDEITFYPTRDKARVTFRLDPASSPKAITLTEQEGDDKGASVPGIYELNGDRLKLCIVMKKS